MWQKLQINDSIFIPDQKWLRYTFIIFALKILVNDQKVKIFDRMIYFCPTNLKWIKVHMKIQVLWKSWELYSDMNTIMNRAVNLTTILTMEGLAISKTQKESMDASDYERAIREFEKLAWSGLTELLSLKICFDLYHNL